MQFTLAVSFSCRVSAKLVTLAIQTISDGDVVAAVGPIAEPSVEQFTASQADMLTQKRLETRKGSLT